MTVYVCLHCEYRFDTEKGDMPDDWVCPECAALGVDAFIVEEE